MAKKIDTPTRFLIAAGRKFLLHPAEAVLLCRMAFWVTVLSVATRCLSLPRALQMVSARQQQPGSQFDLSAQQRLARTLDLLLSSEVLMFHPICWKRAAILHRLLAQRGVATRIRFGVRAEQGKTVTGHAWLESNGAPILEKEPPDYVVTYTFPSDEDFDLQLAMLSHE